MLKFRLSWECMDCEVKFKGNVDTDDRIILCPKCSKDFEKYLEEDESRSYTIDWWVEFIRIFGVSKKRKEKDKFKYLDELLA